MTNRILHIILLSLSFSILCTELASQSTSFGNTFVHNDGESVIFGMHDFDQGTNGILPGIIGTERENLSGEYGILGFSDVSPGWKGIGNDSYVDGYVKKYGPNGFVFPIGDNDKYRPIGISGGDETVAAYFSADPALAITNDLFGGNHIVLPQGGPFPQSSKQSSIVEISNLEYWDIDGDQSTMITLTWDIFSEIDRITDGDLSRLSIVGWTGTRWEVIPSKIDILYLNRNRSTLLFNGGISNKVQGSLTTLIDIKPDDYLAYTFGSIASGSIGDFVWEDLNRNGIQEVGEPGIEGVQVDLILNANDSIIATIDSDENGKYVFAGVEPGVYYLKFTPESTYTSTLTNQGIQALNSDLTFNNTTPPFQLDINEIEFGMDGGFYQTGSIGNFVWLDTNSDGIQDDDEIGMEGIRVELFNESAELTAATVTGPDGSYTFTNLPPGQYMISVVPPPGYGVGPYRATLDQDIDSDIDPLTMMSEMITLLSGMAVVDIDAAISTECAYTASIDITSPDCGTSNGFIQATVSGVSGPYTYEWSTGSTDPFIENVDTGRYTLMIFDSNNCPRAFNIHVDYETQCNMICAELDAHVFIEGTYNYDEEQMDKRLNELGYLPGQQPTTFLGKYTGAGQPYDEEPWFMTMPTGLTFESSSTAENNLYYDEDVVDWVLVSLRADEDIEYETCTRAGMLHQDGRITFVEDDCCLVDPTKNYFIVVEHRNHLIVMTPTAVPVLDNTLSFDFRFNNSYTRLFGYGQKEVAPGIFAMYAANGDQYNSAESAVDINVGDQSEWLKSNGLHSSYYRQDFDLNGDANVQDKGMYLKNIGIFTDVKKGN